MKIIKPVQIPLDILIQGLKNSTPNYIKISDLQVNLNVIAAGVTQSLLWELDEAKQTKSQLHSILETMLPYICQFADLSDRLALGFSPDTIAKTKTDKPKASRGQFATVLAATVRSAED